MATTTSNQDLGVTTTTSDHVVRTQGATDVNWNPPVKVPVPHANEVPTTAATEHTTDRTLVGGGNVVRAGDAIGPSSGPPHPDNGAGGGVASATHLQEARVVSGSPNVRTEGTPLGRSTDTTTNNHGNTVGQVQGANPTNTVAVSEEDKLLACSLDTTDVTCSHGRKPGPNKLLEITARETITLKATRKNAKTGGGPACTQPTHTRWVIRQTKRGRVTKPEEVKTGDEITLDNSWFTWGDLDKAPPAASVKIEQGGVENTNRLPGNLSAEANRLQSTPQGQAEVRGYGQRNDMGRGEARTAMLRGYRAGQQADRAIMNGAGNVANAVVAGREIIDATKDFADFLKVWNAAEERYEVTVEAFACSGSHKYTFRSFPGKEMKFDATDYIEKVRTAFQALQRIFAFVRTVASAAGRASAGEAKLCDPFTFVAKVGWEEMTQDVDRLNKKKFHCDRGWRFEVTGTIAKNKERFAIPVLWFANLFFPGAGTAANKLVEALGADFTIGIGIDMELQAAAWADRRPGASPTVGGGFPVKFELFADIQLNAGRWVQISGKVSLKGRPVFEIRAPSIDLFAGFIALLPGEAKVGFKGVARIDAYFWSSSTSIEYEPASAKVAWGEVPLRVFSLFSR